MNLSIYEQAERRKITKKNKQIEGTTIDPKTVTPTASNPPQNTVTAQQESEQQRMEQLTLKTKPTATTPKTTAATASNPLSVYGNIDTDLKRQNAQINQAQDLQEQQAYITYQKLQKYLKLGNAAQGIKGISSGDQISAANNYQNQLSDTGSDYEALRQSALQTSQDKKTLIDTNLTAEQKAAADEEKYWSDYKITAHGATVLGLFTALYDKAEPDENGNISADDYNALMALINDNKGKIDRQTQIDLEEMMYGLRANGAATGQPMPDVQSFISGTVNSDENIVISGGETYQKNGEGVDGKFLEGYYGTLENGKVYGFNLRHYIYYNGKAYRVKKVN